MNPSEKFRKFAAEREAMAKFARSPESKATWSRLAVRWVRCAELTERHWLTATHNRTARQPRRPDRSGLTSATQLLPESADLRR